MPVVCYPFSRSYYSMFTTKNQREDKKRRHKVKESENLPGEKGKGNIQDEKNGKFQSGK